MAFAASVRVMPKANLCAAAPKSLALSFLLGTLACAPQAHVELPLTSTTPASRAIAQISTDEAIPLGRLPSDVRPLACALDLHVDPKATRFGGTADIDINLTVTRQVIWMHGKHLTVKSAVVTPDGDKAGVAASWAEADTSGVAKLTLARSIGPGKSRIHIEYDAPFASDLSAVYTSHEAGVAYAFTQFESIAAREAFPAFDEPGFKIPFSLALTVASEDKAIGNTREASRTTLSDGRVRVQFAPTEPIPSYLVAFAVGPFDIVEAKAIPPNAIRKRPLALRGIVARGRGKEITYALAHTGEILSKLEGYVGVEYPYDKLDILAVPEKEGAMENPGAVTFSEYLVLMDEKTAPTRQKRAYAEVMAHELAHQWFGDLVTTAWWDDIWLNEAFATWFAARTVDAWDPTSRSNLDLLNSVHGAMDADALVAARRIRQPIESFHDIANAFDDITYLKGGGVIAMFERAMGQETFQKGIHAYLEKHRFGSATADDLLASLAAAAGRDIAIPFRTFLDQPGAPIVDVALACDAKGANVSLKQSRYFPKGSSGSDTGQLWSIPMCIRYETNGEKKETCTQLSDRTGELSLPLAGGACPSFLFPNAEAAGYFRFELAALEIAKLRTLGLAKLSVREKLSFAHALKTGVARGSTAMKDALGVSALLVREETPRLALDATDYVRTAHDWFDGDAAMRERVEAYARALYAPVVAPLGWAESPKDSQDTSLRRAEGLRFLAFTARDPAVRAEATRRGGAYALAKDKKIHPEAVALNHLATALGVVGEDANAATFDALYALLAQTEDVVIRQSILGAIGRVQNPELAKRARELAFDPKLRETEFLSPMFAQLAYPKHREDVWTFVKTTYEKLVARLGNERAGRLIYTASTFCDEPHAKDVEAFFGPRIAKLPGGPRKLASVAESIRLCAAKQSAQAPSAREAFGNVTPKK
jgi:cytosol alanyl aminopeptidase